jgi:hypothetical protein
MKRLEALKLIANQLDFIYGKFQGARTEFESQELADANLILTTLEQAGMLPPPDTIDIRAAEKETGVVLDISYNNPLNDDYSLNLWEKE